MLNTCHYTNISLILLNIFNLCKSKKNNYKKNSTPPSEGHATPLITIL